ncbi:GntR family transcriptional regulator [Yersinia enterocolitica]|nr:GntR family transcriptional regulator [Yersinia enterocolitica]KGA67910.1 aminotransferase class I and II family protein [Yersinia enterocolitica]KGA69945.1 aminotransferase class I and II family protein [Yersinia enterocolitica]
MKKNVAIFPGILLKKGKIREPFYLVIKELILNGQLKAGRKLPSSRTLSEMMSISRNSILSGFERLIDEGYLVTKKGSGTYVTSVIPDEVIQVKSIYLQEKINNKNSTENINSHMQVMKKIWDMTSPYAGNNMKFNIGVGCIDLFPHELWGRLLGRTWRQFRHQDWRLNEPLGFKPLRLAISEYVRTTRGLNCTDEQILIVNGTQQAINLAAQVLLQQGDEVWLDEPGYDGARPTTEPILMIAPSPAAASRGATALASRARAVVLRVIIRSISSVTCSIKLPLMFIPALFTRIPIRLSSRNRVSTAASSSGCVRSAGKTSTVMPLS